MKFDIEKAIASIDREFVGVWRFRTYDESLDSQTWCASVLAGGRLVDTEPFPSLAGAIDRAVEIVEKLRA